MSKNTEIKFVGQPIFSQVLNLIDKHQFKKLVAGKRSDYYYKAFKSWTHLVTMLFGILSRCDSMAETCAGLTALSGKLNHVGLDEAPAKSTAGDGLRNRDSSFFEGLYYQLAERYKSFLSDSRTLGLSIKDLYIIDSTTIRLFSITEAKVHDKNFLKQLGVPAYSMLVFDKAYNFYRQFANWNKENIYFVTRQKDNAVYKVIETVMEQEVPKGKAGVKKEEIIEVKYKEDKEEKTLRLRRISYQDEKNRQYVFITNNFTITAEEVALIYKKRWQIELLFKKMKQNFQLHYFYGENETAIRTQVWCTLIAQLLLTVLQKKAKVKKAFSTVAALIRIHLVSMLDVTELLQHIKRTYEKIKNKASNQGGLFPT